MIQIDNLSMSYGDNPLFENVTFTLQKRERCGLVGRNGSGKSTLFRIIAGEENPDGGRVVIPKGYRLGYLNQHIRFTQPTLIEEAALSLPTGEEDHLYKVEKILFGLGFKEEDLSLSPAAFSGGYQLRLHLAKVLIQEPDCLLLDEPTNYLDIVSIRWFSEFLQDWKGEFILITHDREFMDSVTTHTIGIHKQKLRKVEGNSIQFFEQVFLAEEVYERTRQNLQKKQEHLQAFIDRFGAKASKAAQAKSKQKALNRLPVMEKLKELYQLSFHFNEAPFPGKKMVEAKNIDFSYGETPLICDLSLTIEKGERIAIIGKNGRGKSTLLQLLAGELQPLGGSTTCSENVQSGYFGQTNIERLHSRATIEEEIAVANPKLNYTQIKGICGLLMFSGDLSMKKINVLSGGEKSRVLLGKILAKPCNLLFLDEPTHHLDIESIEALIDALEEFDGGVVIVTHSELILRRLELDKIVICHLGKQELFEGNYDDFLREKGWPDEAEKKKPKERKEKQQPESLGKVTKSLEQEIKKCEEKIIALETEQQKEQELLVVALEKQSDGLRALVRSTEERQKQIDAALIELEKLDSAYREKLKEFKSAKA